MGGGGGGGGGRGGEGVGGGGGGRGGGSWGEGGHPWTICGWSQLHCKNKLVVLTIEWLPWLQSSWRYSGYERFALV